MHGLRPESTQSFTVQIKLSQRAQRIKPSPTLAVSALAARLKAEGRDVISLGAGEPDFDTPDHIKEAAIRALREGQTKYTAVGGTPVLKQAIVNKFARENGLDYTPDQVLVSCGGKQSFYNLCQALLDAGDEVIIPAPYWVSYPDMVLLADATPVIVSTTQAEGFKLSPKRLAESITPHTRLFVLNSPSNPTGIAYSPNDLQALASVLLDHPQVLIATDDMYEHILFGGTRFVNILNICPELYPRTIVLNGVSKAYAMTGWRIGYAGGPKPLIQAMTNVQSQSTSNPASISQAAAQAALEGDQTCVARMRAAFETRHRFVVEALNRIDGIDCLAADGTFYCLPNVQGLMARFAGIEDDVQFAQYLLDKTGVALVPGSAFGAPGHVRISFATSLETLKAAIERIRHIAGQSIDQDAAPSVA